MIVGSLAGALTGLQFVVMTLISEAPTTGGMREIRAFGTPTVVYFCVEYIGYGRVMMAATLRPFGNT